MKLIEGRDYTVQNGLMVFTQEYLLARGYCCRSGCRNCPYGFKKELVEKSSPRVISLVPSWTETLIEAGINVVGCTRYCLHPEEKVKGILKVGGTKKVEAADLEKLNPDFILVDREENTLEIAELAGDRAVVTHINSVKEVGPALGLMAKVFQSEKLLGFATRWEKVSATPANQPSLENMPGVIEWVKKPGGKIEVVLYLIWRKPYMAVGSDTFIGSMLEKIGVGGVPVFENRYPEVKISEYPKENTLLLFSSEPYPFLREKEEISKLGFAAAIVDGEKFSWFGVRSLRFLEGALGNP